MTNLTHGTDSFKKPTTSDNTTETCTSTTCRKTVKCFVSDEGNPSAALSVFNCAGVCAIRVSYLRDRKLAATINGMKPKDVHEVDGKVTHLCQQQRAHPSSAVDVCTDTKVRYPNLQIIFIKERKEAKEIYTVLNQPLEQEIRNSLRQPRVSSVKSVKTPVTGQLTFRQLCRVLTDMELRIRKVPVELEERAKPSYKRFDFTAGGNGHSLVKKSNRAKAKDSDVEDSGNFAEKKRCRLILSSVNRNFSTRTMRRESTSFDSRWLVPMRLWDRVMLAVQLRDYNGVKSGPG
uniref:PRE_C2HC domain-containing protein n=1 Tax=Angiostrongylus cantonensis TaxID=6313 RepID=A0A158P7P7_ANGCA